MSNINKQLIERSHRLSRRLAMLSLFFPALCAIGWIFDLPLLTKGFPALPSMASNTFIGLILSAMAVLFFHGDSESNRFTIISRLLGIMISGFGIVTLCEYLFHLNLS